MSKKQKVWFAEKIDGSIINLTEDEALTHFEKNQIASRMRLKFIGTSNGEKYAEGKRKVVAFLDQKMKEDIPEYQTLNELERKVASANVREAYASEVKEITDLAYKEELETAKANGVERPDVSRRIITQSTGADASRDKIISNMNL